MSYHRPTDLALALDIASGPARTVIAGGTDVFPAMKQGQTPDTILDMTAVPEMAGISRDGPAYRFGAATRWTQIIQADLPPAFDALKQAARQVGSVQIQNSATLAGNLCNASPAADGAPPLLALDALVEVSSAARGVRAVPLTEFILGVRQTALQSDELVTAVIVPQVPQSARSRFEKLGSRSFMVISIAMVSAVVVADGQGRITDARVAVGACSAVAQRLVALEHDCIGKRASELVVTPEQLTLLSPIDDVRGSGVYRMDAVAELCLRALRGALVQ